jgi:8-oxo-dGTP pyrophosphatase MutT (NUDIX family)
MSLDGRLDLLGFLYDNDNQLHNTTNFHIPKGYKQRVTSRAVVTKGNEIALAYISNEDYYKLLGGGKHKTEDPIKTLKREVEEELGYKIEVKHKVGRLLEVLHEIKVVQHSFCYIAQATQATQQSLTEVEIAEGLKVEWCTLDTAIMLMDREPHTYNGKHRQKRDLIFLKKAKELMYQNGKPFELN